MKLPTPKKLPSGNWRVQIQVGNKRVSFTAPTERECLAKAAAAKADLTALYGPTDNLTVGKAIDRYIQSKDAILSPSTILGYKRIRQNSFADIINVPLSRLTQEMVQKSINAMAKVKSPKTVRNAHGLLSAILAEYKPNMILRTTLPQKERPDIHIPNDDEITAILKASRGKTIELPILLAVWLGLRASEICGLTWDCIEGDYIHIKQAIVIGEGGPTLKKTKTVSGDRKIKAPKYILDLINSRPRTNDYIVHMSGSAMCKCFTRLCKKEGIPHYRFHDLRHTSASVALFLGVPDKYSMRRMGHATDNMLKNVYQHTLQQKEDEYAQRMDEYFTARLSLAQNTKEQNAHENAHAVD